MNRLRIKLTVLFVTAILVVVGLATWITFNAAGGPPPHEHGVMSMAAQVRLILELTGKLERRSAALMPPTMGPGYGIRPAPEPGDVLEFADRDLRDALQREGLSLLSTVTVPKGRPQPIASIKISDNEWLIIPAPMPPPPPKLPAFAGWILLVAAGTTGVAVMAVYRMTQPLALVEKAITEIGPAGDVPLLPETGPEEVRATAKAINMLSLRLRGAMESRMRLVAAAGHDLRTPMTRLRLRAEFLDEDERKRWLADIDELDRIADSAIRLVHEETEHVDGNAVRLDYLVSDTAGELQETQLDVQLTHSEPVNVHVRPLSLKRALRNLMINAATHGKGAEVSVKREGDWAVVLIEDRGPGIPEAMQERAFEPFFRIDPARRRSAPGAGLGLAIAQEIVKRNRGGVILASRAGGGLTQRIELPLAP